MFRTGFPYREVEVMVFKSGNKAVAGEPDLLLEVDISANHRYI